MTCISAGESPTAKIATKTCIVTPLLCPPSASAIVLYPLTAHVYCEDRPDDNCSKLYALDVFK